MVNPHVTERLAGIQQMLMGAYSSGKTLSASSKGTEREFVIDLFLSQVLTPQFRFSSGDATDQTGLRSGQLDVVVEFPFVPSLPIVGNHKTRLFLAEGIGCVIEVKSNAASQWDEVIKTATELNKLKRIYGSGISSGRRLSENIPLFVIGYTGWKQLTTVQSHLEEGLIDGILILDEMIFASTNEYSGLWAEKHPMALWGMISSIHYACSTLSTTANETPFKYFA
jgi:hypothetical protein